TGRIQRFANRIAGRFAQCCSSRARLRRMLILTAVAGSFALGGCVPSSAPKAASDANSAERPMRVAPITPGKKTIVRTVELPGRTEAYEVTPLYANVTGYVTKVAVDIGDRVTGPRQGDEKNSRQGGDERVSHEGMVLCEVHVPELEEQMAEKKAGIELVKSVVAQAEAGVKVAEAGLASAEARVAEARATVAREEALFNRWQSEYQRVERLASTGAVTQKVAEETRAQLSAADAARQEVTAKIAAVEALQNEARAALEKAKADVEAEKSHQAVAVAEERRVAALLTYTKIRAPFDGVVVQRGVHTGHLVTAGGDNRSAPLLTIMRTDPLRVIIDIPETDAVLVTQKTKVELRVPSLPSRAYAGTITRSSWSLDETSRTLHAEIDLPNPNDEWRPGLYLQAKLTVAEIPDAVAIPKTAVVTEDKQTYCYIVTPEHRIERRAVALGIQAGNEVEVRSGLDGSEQLIGSNPSAFREGQTVEVVAPAK
ncbi:MAG: efflux RND transporter periplasmic adaptor subunit, partial [Aureliella sp.]